MSTATKGTVYLVGAGPGDPKLLTLRGKELLEQADCVIYDRLANEVILEWAPQAKLFYAGKRAGNHALIQEDINRLLVEQAKLGRIVVRLKGGDPCVFGRIGEELTALNAENIPYEIVPGVTAGIAGSAYAGIPVTHRHVSSSVTFITGREALNSQSQGTLVTEGTLVIYMGMKTMEDMVAKLREAGRKDDTPTAVVEWATHPKQRTVTGTLATIAAICAKEDIGSPSIIIVGEVVRLNKNFAWFGENLP
jgi:uroporphyrin-III C-methyltransferase